MKNCYILSSLRLNEIMKGIISLMEYRHELNYFLVDLLFLYSLLSSEFVEKNRSFHYIKYVPWDKTIPKVHTLVGIVFPITT